MKTTAEILDEAAAQKPKLTHRTQIFLTDSQHRWLTIKAAALNSSLAAVIRDLLDAEMDPKVDLMNDPAIKYLLSTPPAEDVDPPPVNDIDWDVDGDPEFNR